ncbi:MAG: hypothetical protein A2015_15420 [Spirochaetes bacterium GWF1_31_7]|nr:MAG: hypothetical protein A2Y30_11840 [Spirochaetes bacterium GWE1_32_154]OHD47255.1 MAG: hypothetical protein A2Y29_02855 [Spirochaetes bacterium GWE2_31_10]OHD52127.1 MAG: hypothetical protein A2015_15420 [Spirochaetes bacterium GWF1_31_7]HBD96311.1 histidine kinase [Spirochaetia bacterium]
MNNTMLDILWIVVASGLVFSMQAGFAMVESGLTRSKNSINVAIKNLTDLGVSIMIYWLFGFAIMFGISKWGLFGTTGFFFEPVATWGAVFFLFQSMFCSTSATIVSGAVAERMKYSSYIISTILLSLIIYPVFGHWVWGGSFIEGSNGWLRSLGFIDFAGSTVVHSLGGWVSLAILIIIGPRIGRYSPDGKVNTINGSNIPNVVLGVIILWFGWFGFNGGSTLAMNESVPGIILRTTLSAAAGMVGSLFIGWPIRKKPDATLVMNGSLAGLVAITASVHAVSSFESVIIGLIGGIVMMGTEELLNRLRIDDAVGAIPVHLAAGIWGTLAVAIFGDLTILGTGLSRINQTFVQIIGIASCGIWTFGLSYTILFLVNKVVKMRVSVADEHTGLNIAEHGVTTEILDLYTTMDAQAKTGDLKLRAPVEPFTEAGQIALMYNKVIDSLEKNTIEKGAYLDILQNVTDGIFLVNRDLTIGDYYSTALETIFGQNNLGGLNIISVISQQIPSRIEDVLHEFFFVSFDNSIKWRNCSKLNPLNEVEFIIQDGKGSFTKKHLCFNFKRLEKDGVIEQLLVLVRDETIQKELSLEMDKNQKENRSEMELLYKILHVEPEIMAEFLNNLEYELNEINREMQNGESNLRDTIEVIFRHSHAIKGEAGLLQIDFIAEKAEELENTILSLRNRTTIEAGDFLPLTLLFSELQKTALNVKDLLHKWLKIDNPAKQSFETKDELFINSIKNMVKRLSLEYGKEIKLHFEGDIFKHIKTDNHKKVKDIIIQLLRNAVFHGIENPSVRERMGKNREGVIHIKSQKNENNVTIQVKDNGHGIDKRKLYTIGVEKGLISSPGKKITDNEIIQLLFASGISTADKPDHIAGKGVGMGMVKNLIRELNGSINIKSKKNEYFDFLVTFPVNGEIVNG